MSGDIPYHAEMLMTYLYQHATPEQLTSARWHCQKIIDAASPTPTNDGEGLIAKLTAIRAELDAFNPDMRLAARSIFEAQEKVWKLVPEILAALNQGAGQ